MEWGARALGHRSILADASNVRNIEILSKMIKGRDFWMPFAPVILDTWETKYIYITRSSLNHIL
jgi:carbamoyltransferase